MNENINIAPTEKKISKETPHEYEINLDTPEGIQEFTEKVSKLAEALRPFREQAFLESLQKAKDAAAARYEEIHTHEVFGVLDMYERIESFMEDVRRAAGGAQGIGIRMKEQLERLNKKNELSK